jgi:nucleoporin NUP159
LEGGDILTFALTKKSTPNKHLPPTSNALLVSLNWLGPGHTFRTSYGATSSAAPVQHIVVLDTKSSTATYFAPDHPYASSTHDQNALVLSLPNWDADSPSNEDHKSLTIVGDVSAVDLEVLGNVGNQWYRQSQENQVSLPLDKEMDDTILLALEADLTDVNSTAPIVYTYLSDGSLQGWHLESSKPYPGLISPGATNSMELSQQQEPGKDSDMASEQTSFGGSSFGQPTPTLNAFGQSSFGQQTTSSFGSQQTSAFGQTGFVSKPVPATSTFAQSSFGQASTFGSSAFGSTGAFGQPNQSISPTSSFSEVKPATGFGAFGGGSTNAFGGGGSGAFGSNSAAPNAFSGLVGNTNSVFGQGSFGSPASSTASPSHSPTMTREASMSDSTPGFGGLSLGSAAPSDSNAVNSMFGGFGSQTTTNQPTPSAFGGSIVKPASGFGAFVKTSGAFDKPATTPTANAFAAPPSQTPAASGFGQSGFASSSFGKSGFGQQAQQPAFGKPSLGAGPVSGGFGAFANASTSLAGAAQKTSAAPIAGGFGAFASAGPSTFGSALEKSVGSAETKPASEAGAATAGSGNGFGAFASTAPSPFGSAVKAADEGKDSSSTTSPFAPKPATGFGAFASTTPSPFGSTVKAADERKDSSTTSPFAPKPATGFGAFASTAPSPFGSTVKAADEGKDSSATTSPFKPATGFGAFASTAPSPFGPKTTDEEKGSSTTTSPFTPKPTTETTTRTSVLGTPTSSFGGNTFSPASAFDAPRKSPFGGSSPFAAGSPQHATSPPSSPEPSSPRRPPASSPFGQTSTPTTSPGVSGGAFGNLVATPSAFKPATGFGAFGSFDTPKSSPFFKKPEETPPPVSAFAQIPSSATTTTSASAAAPAFGTPSVLGGAKSAFAPISPASPTVSKTPATGGFSAFSGSSGGFSAFAQKKHRSRSC